MNISHDRLRELNPSIIYVQQSGLGELGTYGRARTYGPSAQAIRSPLISRPSLATARSTRPAEPANRATSTSNRTSTPLRRSAARGMVPR